MYQYNATILSVYDGDTVTAEVDLGFSVKFKIKLRLSNIDTPEIRGQEREFGLIAKQRVVDLVEGKQVVIKTQKDKTGKYGRYLAEIITQDGVNINELLIEEGLAIPYKK